MHKIFISYHHENDQTYKNALCAWNEGLPDKAFIDKSVYTGDIDESLSDEQIRVKIRDEFLQDSTVTVVLVGLETANRKHVDWEIYSSMRDSELNKKSGILVVLLPSVTDGGLYHVYAPNGVEEKRLYPQIENWRPIGTRQDFLHGGFEFIPERIIDSIINKGASISITTWKDFISSRFSVEAFIEFAHNTRGSCAYDLSKPMRERNS